MSERRRGLGRGLGALIPAAPTPDKTAPGSPMGGGPGTSSAGPVLTAERGVAAAKVASLPQPQVSHETEDLFGGPVDAPEAPHGSVLRRASD